MGMEPDDLALIAEAREARRKTAELERFAARHTAGRKLAFALDYLIRNATKGEGEKHGAADQFAKALSEFIDTERKYA